MAKSIRSKRKRMLRNVKRERYAVKELIRLKDILGVKENESNQDTEMKLAETANVVGIRDLLSRKKQEKVEESSLAGESDDDIIVLTGESSGDKGNVKPPTTVNVEIKVADSNETEMEHSQKLVFHPKTRKDQFGNYPAWFKSKDIKKCRKRQINRDKKKKRLQKNMPKVKRASNRKKRKGKKESVSKSDE